jgi:hypothetical protein
MLCYIYRILTCSFVSTENYRIHEELSIDKDKFLVTEMSTDEAFIGIKNGFPPPQQGRAKARDNKRDI